MHWLCLPLISSLTAPRLRLEVQAAWWLSRLWWAPVLCWVMSSPLFSLRFVVLRSVSRSDLIWSVTLFAFIFFSHLSSYFSSPFFFFAWFPIFSCLLALFWIFFFQSLCSFLLKPIYTSFLSSWFYSSFSYLYFSLLNWSFFLCSLSSAFHFDLFPCIPRFLLRGDHLGADDLWREAIWWDFHQRHPRPAGEGRTSSAAAHQHHRCLHGHGQM